MEGPTTPDEIRAAQKFMRDVRDLFDAMSVERAVFSSCLAIVIIMTRGYVPLTDDQEIELAEELTAVIKRRGIDAIQQAAGRN